MPQKKQSHSMSFHTRGADFRAVFVSAAEAINAATAQIKVDSRVLYQFSELTVCTNLLASLFRDLHDITLEVSTEKFFRSLIVEATPEGIFRAACQPFDAIQVVQNTNAVDADVLSAKLVVTKRYPQVAEQMRSTVGSKSNSIPNLVQQYLHESEQISTLMLTGTRLCPDAERGVVADKCFGLLIEALPGVSDDRKFIITDNLERLESLTEYFSDNAVKDVMDLLDDIYPGEQWIQTSETSLVYRCRCNREGYLERIVDLAKRDIEEVFGDLQELEVKCGYCANVFHYPRSEVEARLLP